MRQIIDINELRNIQLNILEVVADYCENNGLRYYLDGGTLLGAVRHKGFIPWDDDIDIIMFREDYDKFCKGFNDNRQDDFRVICHKNSKEYHFPYAKIMDIQTKLIEENAHQIDLGINIDLFVLDSVPDENLKLKLHDLHAKIYRDLLSAKLVINSKDRKTYKRIIIFLGKILSMPFSFHFLCNKINKIASHYSYFHTNSRRVASVTTMIYGLDEVFERKWYDAPIQMEFEGREYNIPKGYDNTLKCLYHDYMTLPPNKEQLTHHAFMAFRI